MVSAFDALEADFFGDLAEDTHGVWEVFEFVRLHYSELTDNWSWNNENICQTVTDVRDSMCKGDTEILSNTKRRA
jgi:hypothetical protein